VTTPSITPGIARLRTATTVATAIAATILLSATALWRAATGQFVEPWQASQFWVTYRDGFVRRGLPGEVLSVVTGGSPTIAQMTAAATALLVAAGAAWAVLARAVWRVAAEDARAIAAALVVVSPFAFSLLVRDIGRYDTIGIIVFVMFAAVVLHSGRPQWPALTGMSAATAVAVASQELLIAFLVPSYSGGTGRSRLDWSTARGQGCRCTSARSAGSRGQRDSHAVPHVVADCRRCSSGRGYRYRQVQVERNRRADTDHRADASAFR
jgi:hypothetical protein